MKKNSSLGAKLVACPYYLWAAIFVVVPVIMVAYYAFTSADGAFTVDNILELRNYGDTFLISILYSLVATAVSLLIAYPFAYVMSRKGPSSQRIMMMLVMLPQWMNLLIRTYSWMNILERNGLINNLLEMIGAGPLKMIGTPGAVIFGMIYNYLPYMILPLYATIVKINPRLIEAAEDLGCNSVQVFSKVVLPLSIPGILSGITMVFVPAVSTFYISQKLGGTDTVLIGDVIERQFKQGNNPNLGAALSLVLMLLVFVCTGIMNRFGADEEGGVIA